MNQPTEPALTYSSIYIATKKPAPPAFYLPVQQAL
jgi:hypothetical protein